MTLNKNNIFGLSFICALTLASIGWVYLDRERDDQYQKTLQNHANNISEFVEATLTEISDALNRQARRWERLDSRQHPSFIRDAEDYARGFPMIKGIALTDKDATIEMIVPYQGNEKAIGFKLTSEPTRAAMIQEALATQALAMSKPIPFVQGDMGLLVAIPLYKNGHFEGFLSTAISSRVLVDTVTQRYEEIFATLELSIAIDDTIIYQTPNFNRYTEDHQHNFHALTINTFGSHSASYQLISSDLNLKNEGINFPEYYATLIFIFVFLLTTTILLLLRSRQDGERLVKALEDATASEKAKTLFLSNMSHELRTPLNGIYGALQVVEGATEAEKSLLEAAKHSTEALNTIVSDILDIQKMSAGKLHLSMQWCKTIDLFKHVQKLHSISAKTKGIDFDTVLSPDLPDEIKCDAIRLEQILNNVISNAIKFTPDGMVQLKATYQDAVLQISVVDTGIGMDNKILHQLFERFTQADNSSTRQFGGTGLGMAITKELVELMQGEIAVDSVLGKGTTFMIRIPLDGRHSASPQAAQAIDPVDVKDLRVLLVDDVTTNTLVGAAMLAPHVAHIETASSGQEALEKLASQPFDVLLTDIGMPHMSGEELQQIANKHYPFMAVIALTGNAAPADIQHYKDLGFDGVATKPFTTEALLVMIQQALAKNMG